MSRDDTFYRALLARDYRFDGKFFVGVKTTGIYCRPICPARPKRENVEFFLSAPAAEKKGYRPCLRCRPECAPGSPAWSGRSAVVQRALRLISDRSTGPLSDQRLADKVGLSARHLRRLFALELGETPKQIRDAARLGFARQLVVETPLPLCEIAYASGFGSLRRFNDAFSKRFRRSPSQLRRGLRVGRTEEEGITLSLSFRPPFDWHTLLADLAGLAKPGLEAVTDSTYERRFRLDGQSGLCRVSFPDPKRNLLHVRIQCPSPKLLLPVVRIVRGVFDLDSDPLLITNAFSAYPSLERLWRRFPGLRLARAWDSHSSDTDFFPKDDPVLRQALRKHPGLDPRRLRPWRSYLARYLKKEMSP